MNSMADGNTGGNSDGSAIEKITKEKRVNGSWRAAKAVIEQENRRCEAKERADPTKSGDCTICKRMPGLGVEKVCAMCRFEAKEAKMTFDAFRKARASGETQSPLTRVVRKSSFKWVRQ